MTTAWVPLATTTLGASATEVTFSSIPANYRDLVLVIAGTTDPAASVELYFNGDFGSGYSIVNMIASSAGPESTTTSGRMYAIIWANQTAATIQIMDYSATDKHKAVLFRSGSGTDGELYASAGRWANTSAITSLTFKDNQSRPFQAGTTISLYGSNKL